MLKSMIAASLAATALLAVPAAAFAQAAPAERERSYDPGTVWVASRIKVLPGQFENYLDYLAGQWKRVQELGKREKVVVDYHVLATTNPRQDEPDLVLVIEYRDFLSTAQQEKFQDSVEKMLSMGTRAQDAAAGGREPMRQLMGSIEYQELNLK
jgi:hypothetical protein